ncbi:MAG TPA: transketolase [bacterium]|jgi:transketolase|uniref:Putative transketolase N-terminal section (TK) n=1 Tax=uncultured candidate division WWE3 bacterium EJ0ADIGA11YD11 TaxID=500145 RepID=B0KVB6_UNCKA|nr:putative transketolase N-terminal section (TK) [uncultured candidate division WWE3 bacterium EJ0ADIGA11YD11]HOS88496.1 transketolase [bacterium]HQG58271.1 transketolase [bacterium]HQG78806.1 transketolase [bacterium]HQK41469.1 transketolase [bacterium]
MPVNKKKTAKIGIEELYKTSNKLKQTVIDMLTEAGSGHTAGSLGTAEIFTALYFQILNINPKKPYKKDRDRFLLSNGHICPIWYATLSERGFFPKSELWKLRKINSKLQGHPKKNSLPGIENTSGSLGQGLSQAIGIAIAAKMDDLDYRIYCMTGDGELNEGQIWESAMFAPNKKLNNITWIIDRNNIQSDGKTEDVMPLENLKDKLESFNWFVIEINGHSIEEIISACKMAKSITQRPTAIIAHTIPGEGIEFMENNYQWHGKVPSKKEAIAAKEELRSII